MYDPIAQVVDIAMKRLKLKPRTCENGFLSGKQLIGRFTRVAGCFVRANQTTQNSRDP